MRKILFYLFVFIAIIFFTTDNAYALTVSPIRFELNGNPGETITQEISLLNETDVAVIYYSSYSNFEAQGETGNPSFVDPKEGLGTWMTTAPWVNLPAKHSQTIPLSISIPKDAEPGGHFAVVFFGTEPPVENGQVAIGAKTGILVLLTVNGKVKEAGGIASFNIKDNKFFYNTLPVLFEYKFRNDGGDRIKPSGKLLIRNSLYIPTEKLPGNPVDGNILPNSTRKFEVKWVEQERPFGFVPPVGFFASFFDDVIYQWRNFAFGFYFAKLSLSYGSNLAMSQESGTEIFFVFPWQLLLLIAFVLIIVFYFGGKTLSRYNRHIIEQAKKNTHFGASHEK